LLANLAAQEMVAGTASEAASLARRALDGGLLTEQTSASATFYDALVSALVADDFELVARYCDAGLSDARRRGSLRDVSLNYMFRSHLNYRRGRIADAESDASTALDTALEGGFVFATTAAAFLIDALIERGELGAAAASLDRVGGASDIPDTWMTNWLVYRRARLRLATGDVEGGLADLQMLGLRERGYLGRNPSVYPYRSSVAITLAQRGEREDARMLALEELNLAHGWGTSRSIGMATAALGLVEGGERGLERLREAVSVLEPCGARLEYARAMVELGAALRRAGTRVEARERLAAGMDLAHRCGATALAERAREELIAAGARPRRPALTGLDALTASERRVTRAAADGLANKQIAQALFVTVRTVEMHLSNAYRKLDISSREELQAELFDTD
jgi:DNA-binding CsgD family transcriptional regulator